MLKKEMLIAMGLSEEDAEKVLAENGKGIATVKKQLEAQTNELETLREQAKELETIKSAQMTDQEKLNKAIADAEAMKSQYTKQLSKLRAEKVFANAGITEDEYKGFIDNIVFDDGDMTEKLATSFVNLISSKVSSKEQEMNAQSLQNMGNTKKGDPKGDPEDENTSFVKGMVHFANSTADTSAFE